MVEFIKALKKRGLVKMKYFLIIIFFFLNLYGADNITLQLNWKHQFQFAGYYMAKELGYYKDAGINLKIKEYSQGIDRITEIEKNRAQFAIGRSDLIIDRAKGKDLVALGAIYQHSPLMLLVRSDSGINTLHDLKNKKVMITTDAKSSASVIAMLNSQNIQLSDIIVQKHSFDINDLINKKTDAMASYISNEPYLLDSKNIPYKIFHPKDYGFDLYNDLLFTTSDFIEKHPKLTKDFFDATIKGWEYAFNNITKTAQLIHRKYNTQNKSLIQLIWEGEELKKLAFHENSRHIGCLDKDKLQKIVEIYKIMGLIHKDIDLDPFVYKHNDHEVLKLKLFHRDIYLYSSILILSIIGFISIVFYLTIKRKWLHTKKDLEKEIEEKTREILQQTYIDPLTDIQNRKAYVKKIDELFNEYKRYATIFSIILIDIDDFKQINDNYGHRAGDNVLIEFARLISSHLRESDFFYRIGGEEFIVLLPHTDLQNGHTLAEKLRKVIEEELTIIKNKTVTISLGLTQVNENDNEDTLYKRVDKFLYDSKTSGKNKVSAL